MKVVGLRIEKYIGEGVSGHNLNFEYYDAEVERHVLCCIMDSGKRVEITLSESVGECGSGWCIATYGNIDFKEVERFAGFGFRPKKLLFMDDIDETVRNLKTDVFSVSSNGGDSYYPMGGYNVNMDLFIETPRHKPKRPVWVFMGKSNAGKSFLSGKIKDLSVFETDSVDVLPDVLKQDIIVLGNRGGFIIEDVRSRIFGDADVQVVNFM